MKKTKVINLYGGPGCGKSTTAAELYVLLKRSGYSVELVREYVKDWAWQNREVKTLDQLFVTGKQAQRESILYGKVDFIITDSPLMMGSFYMEYYQKVDYITAAVKAHINLATKQNITSLNFLLDRNKKYNTEGRYESEEDALKIDKRLSSYLNSHVNYELLKGPDNERAIYIFNKITK